MNDTHADLSISHKFGDEPHRISITDPEKVSRPLIIQVFNKQGNLINCEMKAFYKYIELDMKMLISGEYRVIISGWRPMIQ